MASSQSLSDFFYNIHRKPLLKTNTQDRGKDLILKITFKASKNLGILYFFHFCFQLLKCQYIITEFI